MAKNQVVANVHGNHISVKKGMFVYAEEKVTKELEKTINNCYLWLFLQVQCSWRPQGGPLSP